MNFDLKTMLKEATNKKTSTSRLQELVMQSHELAQVIAKRRSTSGVVLSLLVSSLDVKTRALVARNPNCLLHDLQRLSTDSELSVVKAVIENLETPDAILEILSRHQNYQIRQAVAKRLVRKSSSVIFENLVADRDGRVRAYIARLENVDSNVLKKYASDPIISVRQAVIQNWQTPYRILVALARDEFLSVRLELVARVDNNYNLPTENNQEIAEILFAETNETIVFFVCQKIAPEKLPELAIRPDLSINCILEIVKRTKDLELLAIFANHEAEAVRCQVAASHACSEQILVMLSNYQSLSVQLAVVFNSACPQKLRESIFIRLLTDLTIELPFFYLRFVVEHPTTSEQLLKLLRHVSDSGIVHTAKWRLQHEFQIFKNV